MIKIDKLYANWGKTIMLALGILALAFFLRLLNIKNGQTPIFGDEAIYIRWVQIMRADPTLRFVSLSDGKQPLYMWALMPFLKVYSDFFLFFADSAQSWEFYYLLNIYFKQKK